MPFLTHFGLATYPFGLTPNPALYYAWGETESLLAALKFSITRGDGLLKIVGEVGSGKTLLCRLLLDGLNQLPIDIAYLNAPVAIQPNALPALVAHEFGIKRKAGQDEGEALRTFLLARHAQGRRCVLVIDEAQALGAAGLEVVRLLSNLETETDKLLQIVLFGQAELDRLLHQKALRQILQRIHFSFMTRPFPREVVDSYIRFRLEHCAVKAGKGRHKKSGLSVSFAPQATSMIARASGGLPRLVNVLADKALLAAYAQGVTLIEPAHVHAACRETAGLAWPWNWINKFLP
ncbi:MAG: AAA family ATPase [Bdellovibrionales bacterium]|jgi:type II secretory pathway predicted ATPase ExeA